MYVNRHILLARPDLNCKFVAHKKKQENGAAFDAGGLEVGQLILEVDNHKVEGMQHQNIAKLIAESYTKSDRQFISFLVTEAKKSNLEPKPTALIYLETVIVIIHFCLNIIFFLL